MDEILDLAADLAKPFEGLYLEAYFDPVGYPTQGYGRLLSRQVYGPLGRAPLNKAEMTSAKRWLKDTYPAINEATAEQWLEEDMINAVRSAIRLCPKLERPEQYAALADFAFNCGAGNLQISALRRKANRGDIEGAAEEFKKWVFARGVKLPGLVRRREAERAMFLG